MQERKQSYEAAIRQALRCISHQHPIPTANRWLSSALVMSELQRLALESTPDNQRFILQSILKQLVNEYGLETPVGKQAQQIHGKQFEVLFHLLQGRSDKLGIPDSTYERYHANGVRMLVEMLRQAENALMKKSAEQLLRHE